VRYNSKRMNISRDQVQEYILSKLAELSQDWDDPGEIAPNSLIFTELGFESLDAVVLGVTIQGHYQRQMPFAELLAELGEQRRDLRVSELIDFVHGHLIAPTPEPLSAGPGK
jgi:acyl carrier protein